MEQSELTGKIILYGTITGTTAFTIMGLFTGYGDNGFGSYLLFTGFFSLFISFIIAAIVGAARRGQQIGKIIENASQKKGGKK